MDNSLKIVFELYLAKNTLKLMENRISDLIKSKKTSKNTNLAQYLQSISSEKTNHDTYDKSNDEDIVSDLKLKKENLTDLVISKYTIDIKLDKDFQMISKNDFVVYINNQILFVHHKKGYNMKFNLSHIRENDNLELETVTNNHIVLKKLVNIEKNKIDISDEIDNSIINELTQMKQESIHFYDFLFFQLSDDENLSIKELFTVENAKQVILFKNYFLYIKDKVYKRKYKKNKEHVILEEIVDEIFVINDLVYYRINDEIHNKMSDIIFKGQKIYSIDENTILLQNNNQYQIIIKESIPKERITINEKTIVLDNFIAINQRNVINWIKIENGSFKVYGSTSVKNCSFLTCDKNGNQISLYLVNDQSQEEHLDMTNVQHAHIIENESYYNQKNSPKMHQNTQKEDILNNQVYKSSTKNDSVSILNEKYNSNQLNTKISNLHIQNCHDTYYNTTNKDLQNFSQMNSNPSSGNQLSYQVVDEESNDDLFEKMKKPISSSIAMPIKNKMSINDINDKYTNKKDTMEYINHQQPFDINSLLVPLFDQLNDEIRKRENAFKKRQNILLNGISDQMNKCFAQFEERLNRFEEQTISKKDYLQTMRDCFETILLPSVEGCFTEMKLQLLTSVLEQKNENIDILLKNGEFLKAVEMAINGSDSDLECFLLKIDSTQIKLFTNQINLKLLDRTSFLIINSDSPNSFLNPLKTILSVIDVNEFEETDFSVFTRILKRFNQIIIKDEVFKLLLETQTRLFGKACIRKYNN